MVMCLAATPDLLLVYLMPWLPPEVSDLAADQSLDDFAGGSTTSGPSNDTIDDDSSCFDLNSTVEVTPLNKEKKPVAAETPPKAPTPELFPAPGKIPYVKSPIVPHILTKTPVSTFVSGEEETPNSPENARYSVAYGANFFSGSNVVVARGYYIVFDPETPTILALYLIRSKTESEMVAQVSSDYAVVWPPKSVGKYGNKQVIVAGAHRIDGPSQFYFVFRKPFG